MNETKLCKLEECNLDNLKLLERYRAIMINKGSTQRSIDAFCDQDLSLLLRYLGNKSLNDITHMDIENFLYYCQIERKNGSEALNRKYTSMNSFFTQLIKRDLLQIKNPLDKIDRPKVVKKPRGYLNPEEIKKMVDYAKSIEDIRSLTLIELMYSSGCRISEIYQLNRDSLNFNELSFKVLGKGNKIRDCIFSEDAKVAIQEYLKTRDDDLEPLFISREHNRLSRSAMRISIKKIAKGAGIKKNVFCHLLRHSIATNSVKSGISLHSIQMLLGHSSINSTQIYAKSHLFDVRNQFNKVYDQVQ